MPNTPNQNFEIVILFSIVEKPGNYVFEDDSLQGKGCKLSPRSALEFYGKGGRINLKYGFRSSKFIKWDLYDIPSFKDGIGSEANFLGITLEDYGFAVSLPGMTSSFKLAWPV